MLFADPHALIRYPNAFTKSYPPTTANNYRTWEEVSLPFAVLAIGPNPTVFSRIVAARSNKAFLYRRERYCYYA